MPKEVQRLAPNFFLAVVGSLALVLSRVGSGSLVHEHPASAYSWAIPFWTWFSGLPDASIGRFCACRLGAPYRKDTRLARLRAACLQPLDRMCECISPHAVELEGSATTPAAEYLPAFCAAYARAAGDHFRASPPQLGFDEAAALGEGTPARFEKLWVNDLLRDLHRAVTASRRAPGDAHINVRELRAGLRHAILEARGRRRQRCAEMIAENLNEAYKQYC